MSFTVYFDLETGGIEMRHPVIQIAAVAVTPLFAQASTFERKVAFVESSADPEALKINHYSAEAWKDARKPADAVSEFSAWLKPYSSVELISKRTQKPYKVARLAGYNAVTFDGPRLKALYAGEFFPCSYQIRDVMQRAFWWFDEHGKEPESYKLVDVCKFFGIQTDGAHDALTDVRLSIELAKTLAEVA